MISPPSTTCAPAATAIRLHRAGKRRVQRVLHLHRLDDGKTLAGRHALASADEKLQHLAVHRRLDRAIAAVCGRRGGGEILDAHARLAAVAQDIDLVRRHEHLARRSPAPRRRP